MLVSRYSKDTSVFVIEWKDLERLVVEIRNHLPVLSISTSSEDGLLRTFEDFIDLKNFNNSKRSAIIRIGIIARDLERSQRFNLSMSSLGHNNVSLSIDCEEDIAYKLINLYDDTMDSVRPWYSWIARTDWSSIIFAIMCAFILGFSLVLQIQGKLDSVRWSEFKIAFDFQSLLFGMIPMAAGIALNSIRTKFFPMGTFSIGDGVKRFKNLEVYRTVVIMGVVISVAASVFMSIFT